MNLGFQKGSSGGRELEPSVIRVGVGAFVESDVDAFLSLLDKTDKDFPSTGWGSKERR